MRNSNSIFPVFMLVLMLAGIVSWGVNFYKLTQCNFEPTYKAEIIHAVGVFVPPTALITVWLDPED